MTLPKQLGLFMVDLRISETLQTGAVRKPHLPGGESVYLFLEFTIVFCFGSCPAVRSSTFYPYPVGGASPFTGSSRTCPARKIK